MAAPDHRGAHRARQLLGTRADATIQEINDAYRRLVRRLHPDTATTGAPPDATLAEAQAARDLLRTLAQAGRPQQPPPTPRRLQGPGPATPGGRTADIRAGPVRYHGRAPTNRT